MSLQSLMKSEYQLKVIFMLSLSVHLYEKNIIPSNDSIIAY